MTFNIIVLYLRIGSIESPQMIISITFWIGQGVWWAGTLCGIAGMNEVIAELRACASARSLDGGGRKLKSRGRRLIQCSTRSGVSENLFFEQMGEPRRGSFSMLMIWSQWPGRQVESARGTLRGNPSVLASGLPLPKIEEK